VIPSALPDREVLYVFKAEGCEACAMALPEVDRYIAKHPAATVLVLDAAGPYPKLFGISIRATPLYVFRRGNEFAKREGAMKASDIEKWLKQLEGR